MLLLLFLTITVCTAAAKDASTIASECCPSTKQRCCAEAIEFMKPLDCFNEDQEEQMIASSHCIQKTMFGESSSRRLNISDSDCCSVFSNDDNDPDGHCRDACTDALRSPSLSSNDKLRAIKKCRIDNPLFKCFRRCHAWRHTRSNSFDYLLHCPLIHRMKTGTLYLGEEVDAP